MPARELAPLFGKKPPKRLVEIEQMLTRANDAQRAGRYACCFFFAAAVAIVSSMSRIGSR